MFGPNNRGRAHSDRRANDSPEVLRVLDLVERDDEGLLVQGEVFNAPDAQARGKCNRPLVANAVRETVEVRARDTFDGRAMVGRKPNKSCDR